MKRKIIGALSALALALGISLAGPAPAQAQRASWDLVILHSSASVNSTLRVAKDSSSTCADSSQVLLSRSVSTRDIPWQDAACIYIPTNRDALVYDQQARTTTCVESSGWKRLAEPPYPTTYYLKSVRLVSNC